MKAINYTILSDGPSGVQLQAPKKWQTGDIVCFIAGVVLLAFGGLDFMTDAERARSLIGPPATLEWAAYVGLFLIAAGLVDYHLLAKREKVFLGR